MIGGDRDYDRDRPSDFFKAVCSKCKAECEVSIKLTQGRPIYCRDYLQEVPVN